MAAVPLAQKFGILPKSFSLEETRDLRGPAAEPSHRSRNYP